MLLSHDDHTPSSLLQDTRQFWTLFPHTPDNSFLGFVMEPVTMATMVEKKNQGVLYGKESECLTYPSTLPLCYPPFVLYQHCLPLLPFPSPLSPPSYPLTLSPSVRSPPPPPPPSLPPSLPPSPSSGYYAFGQTEFLNTLGEMMELHSTFKVSLFLSSAAVITPSLPPLPSPSLPPFSLMLFTGSW